MLFSHSILLEGRTMFFYYSVWLFWMGWCNNFTRRPLLEYMLNYRYYDQQSTRCSHIQTVNYNLVFEQHILKLPAAFHMAQLFRGWLVYKSSPNNGLLRDWWISIHYASPGTTCVESVLTVQCAVDSWSLVIYSCPTLIPVISSWSGDCIHAKMLVS